jgi:hypothetical protein
MAAFAQAIRKHAINFIALPWMAASEGGHDVLGRVQL